MTHEPPTANEELNADSRRHLRVGWWVLLAFLTLGAVLEALHGFKIGPYLDAGYETRRFMWTLSHAHGTLLAVINIAFALTVPRLESWSATQRSIASRGLLGATLLIPLGFFLGGVVFYAGDPGLGVLLVPAGAMLLFLAVLLTARGAATMSVAAPRKRGDAQPERTRNGKRRK